MINYNTFNSGASRTTKRDVNDVLKNAETLRKKGAKIAAVWEDVKTTFQMLRDYASGKYRDVQWTTIASITFALMYLISPADMVPDAIPIAGLLDDAAVLSFAFSQLKEPIRKYRNWKKQSSDTINI